MPKEMLVEFVPYSTKDVISAFYNENYQHLLLRNEWNVFVDYRGNLVRPGLKYIEKGCYNYKVFYVISKFDMIDFDIEEEMRLAYPEILDYEKIEYSFKSYNGENNTVTYEIDDNAYLNITDLKTKSKKTSTLDRIIVRTVFDNKQNIDGSKRIQFNFKIPFILSAKGLDDDGFEGYGFSKTKEFLISGIKLIRKDYITPNCGYITDDFYPHYFPEEYPEKYKMIKRD